MKPSYVSKGYASLAILAMSLAVIAVYWLPDKPDSRQIALDYWQLHSRRMHYAQDALLGPGHTLPAWYSRELLGTPFWSNMQNFPFIPSRLLVLLTADPAGPYTYTIAVTLSALLAATFTFLYLRRIGIRLTGCATAGWTFACSGYYASRVAAGHLPLLEAYPALPLLLWLTESTLQALERGEPSRRWICLTSIGSACVMLAGHPQLPVYAMAIAGLYSLWRGGLHRALSMWSAMILGVGLAAFSLAPMIALIARSTRVLPLDPPLNDLSMPYSRLAAFFLPWRDGASPLLPGGFNPFSGHPSSAYFWDTVCYTGILPWIAAALLFCCAGRTKPDRLVPRIGLFIAVLGVAGIALSLPLIHQATALIPGTIFRSPARVIYLTEFALAVALGAGVHWAAAPTRPFIYRVVALLLLLIHTVDLAIHDRHFIVRGYLGISAKEEETITRFLKKARDERVAIDYALSLPMDRTVDDIGFFDSIMLARSYGLILDLSGASRELNIQNFNGSEMSPRGLAAMGVKSVITTAKLDDLPSAARIRGVNIYSISSPASRAEFFDDEHVQYLPVDQIHARLRDPRSDLRSDLLLPYDSRPSAPSAVNTKPSESQTVEYRRPDSDRIECTVTTGRNGYLRIIESWDPGWSATVDGAPVPIVPALDALLAVRISPGRHAVQFVYRTPGVSIGLTISVISLLLLSGRMWNFGAKRQRQR